MKKSNPSVSLDEDPMSATRRDVAGEEGITAGKIHRRRERGWAKVSEGETRESHLLVLIIYQIFDS
jgi:hypothetical protein